MHMYVLFISPSNLGINGLFIYITPIIWMYMYAFLFLYIFRQLNLGIHELFFSITFWKWQCVTESIFPTNLSLTKVTVTFFSWWIGPFYIDVVSNLLIALFVMIEKDTFHTKISVLSSGFLSGILSFNKSMPFTVFFKFWTLFLYLIFLSFHNLIRLNSWYKEMTYSMNQKKIKNWSP